MPPDTQQTWTPVAEQAVGILGHAPPDVQLAFITALTLVALAAIYAWVMTHKDKDEDQGTVPAEVMVSVTEEFSRQVGRLAEVVEDMRDTIRGCQTCPFHPNNQRKEERS